MKFFFSLIAIWIWMLMPVAGLGQGEAFNWYFAGNSVGLNFSTDPPSVLTNSSAMMNLWNGRATISDPCGNLLFYTDGDSVWNSNHQTMPNGFGLISQNSMHIILAPHPGNPDQYFIFTTGANTLNPPAIPKELNYSIVDMTLDGGMGDIIMKNILLEDSTSYKIAGVQHSNETDIWVVSLNGATDEFYSYLLSSTGLNTTPVISNVGPISAPLSFNQLFVGQTKISPDGSKLALCFQVSDSTIILDFDASTGAVSNPLFLPSLTTSFNDYNTYGIEFSQDGSKFYRVYEEDSVVYQYDLNSGSPTSIINSVTTLGPSTSVLGLIAPQLGPDGKIYLIRGGSISSNPPPQNNQWLDIIESPNLLGVSSNYIDKGLNIFPGYGMLNFPTFLAHYLLPFEIQMTQDTSNGLAFCQTDTAFFSISGVRGLDSAIWDFGDPASGVLNTANDPAPFHVYNAPGNYFIEAIVYRGCPIPDTLRDTLLVLDQPFVDLGNDTTLCMGVELPLSAGNQQVNYLWQDGSVLNSFSVDTTGLYWADASNACGAFRDSILVGFDTLPALDLGVDTFTCPGSLIPLDITTLGASYLWQDSSTLPTLLAGSVSGLYWAEVSNVCGTERDSLVISWDVLPNLDLGMDTTICAGQSVSLDASLPSFSPLSFLWENNAAVSARNINVPGLYWAEVTNACGSVRDSIQIDVEPIPEVNLGQDQTLCEGETTLLNAAFPNALYEWQDGSNDSTLLVSNAGTYNVQITAFCGTAADSISISYDPIPVIELGNDTTLCEGETLALDATFSGASYQWQNGSTQPFLTVSTAGLYQVILTNTACEFRDSIQVDYEQIPSLSLGGDTLFCDAQTMSLDISFSGATYQWQDGSTDPNFVIAAPGTYWANLTAFCGSLTDSIEVEYGSSPNVDFGKDTTLCEGETLLLDISFPEAMYRWQDGSTSPEFLITEPGFYEGVAENICGEDHDDFVVSYQTLPLVVTPLEDTAICEGASIILDASSNGTNYLWQDGSTLPTFEVSTNGIYSVAISNLCGTTLDSMALETVDCTCYLYVPSGFTPNQDGINDFFQLGFQCGFLTFDLQIFNRWGKLVYQSNNPADSWDGRSKGKAVPEGVYAWRVIYSYQGKTQESGDFRAGTVTVLR